MIVVKFHDSGVVSLCDGELIGKQFEEGKLFLDVSARFYKGENKSKKEVVKILADAKSLNLVGKTVIGIALDEGYISKDDIIMIKGVPHAQIYVCD